MGGGEGLAHASGVNVKRVQVVGFALAGIFYALGALFVVARNGTLESIAGINFMFISITSVVVVGRCRAGLERAGGRADRVGHQQRHGCDRAAGISAGQDAGLFGDHRGGVIDRPACAEPCELGASVLGQDGVARLFRLLRELALRASFIFMSHRMDDVLDLSDRIYVMKDGAVVDVVTRETSPVVANQQKMVGRSVDKQYYGEQRQKPFDAGKVLIALDKVSLPGWVKNTSLRLHADAMLCLVGTEGAG